MLFIVSVQDETAKDYQKLVGTSHLNSEGVVMEHVNLVVKVVSLPLEVSDACKCPLTQPRNRADSLEIDAHVTKTFLFLGLSDFMMLLIVTVKKRDHVLLRTILAATRIRSYFKTL